jgi:DHA1 family bicyclomycin/chloramphenicol resistance-like MFS transporter
MIHDRADIREMARSFSLLMLIASVAPLLAPLAGATLLQAAGWRAIFATMGGLGTVLLGLSVALPETSDRSRRPTTNVTNVTRVWREILWDRQFLACTLSNGFLQGGMYAYLSLASIVLIDVYGTSPMHFSVIIAIHSLGMVVAAQINARLVRCVGLRSIVQKALWTSVVSSVALTAFSDPLPFPVLLVGTFVCISAIGMVAPNLTAMALERHSANAGSASALLGTVLYGIGAATGAVAAHLSSNGPTRALMYVMAWCAVLAVLFSLGIRDESS